jgi:hypothetical protein
MLIIHGTYRMFPRRVAFRNDYCMACNAPRRAAQIRTLDVIHLYFIPLLPLGFWKRWCCCTCGMNPHQLHLTRRLLKTTALVVFLFCTVFFWSVYFLIVPGIAEDAPIFWIFGVFSPAGAVAMAIHLALWKPDEPGYKERLRAVPPADEVICPFCSTAMVDEFFECHCPSCGVRRL